MEGVDRERLRWAWGTFALALLLRILHGLVIDVPSNDGVQYLWQAECFGRGDFAAGFSGVLPAGLGLALAPFVAMGFEATIAAELVLAISGAFAVHVLARIVLVRAPAACHAPFCLLLAASPTAVRFAGEAYSEPLFMLLAAVAIHGVLRDRVHCAALAIGVAFWVRPEAAAFGVLLLGRERRRIGAACLAVLVALLGSAASSWDANDFALVPLLEFYERGLVEQQPLLERFAAWPVAALRGSDFVWMPLAILGLHRLVRGGCRLPGGAWRWVLAFVLLQLAQLAFQVKPRFFQSQIPLLVPLAAVGAGWLLRAGSVQGTLVRWVLWGVALLALTLSLRDVAVPPRQDKLAERELGRALARGWIVGGGIERGELVTDMPRVAYFAGLRPPPPAEWTAALLAPRMQEPAVRIVVLGRRRPGRMELAERFAELYRIVDLPEAVRSTPGAGRLLVLQRK